MDVSRNAIHAVGFIQTTFSIVLALALGEALRQAVADSDDRPIHWNRLPALLSFLLIIFPFFQGMSQHLYLYYLAPNAKGTPAFLMFDGICFLIESALFFVMARALAPSHWRRLYYAIIVLMVVDIGWSGITVLRGIPVAAWIYLDIALATVLLLELWFERGRQVSLRPAFVLLAASFVSTAISYYEVQGIYFG
jgi:hypothetical protein